MCYVYNLYNYFINYFIIDQKNIKGIIEVVLLSSGNKQKRKIMVKSSETKHVRFLSVIKSCSQIETPIFRMFTNYL